jgi:hypothetical protein
VAFVNVHVDEYNGDDMILLVFLKSISTFVTSPMLVVSGIKRCSTEPRLNVVSSLN